MSDFILVVLWTIAIMLFAIVWYVWVHPYIVQKITFYMVQKTLNKLAKKHKNTEAGEKLKKTANLTKEINKEIKL